MKTITVLFVFLIMAMPAMAAMQPPAVIKKSISQEAQKQASAMKQPVHRQFGEPRRERGSRYFEETKSADFYTRTYGKGTMTAKETPAGEKASAKVSAKAKPKATSSTAIGGSSQTPSTYSAALSSTTGFTKNSRFKRWNAPTGDQLRGQITK